MYKSNRSYPSCHRSSYGPCNRYRPATTMSATAAAAATACPKQFIEHLVLYKVKPGVDSDTLDYMAKNISTLPGIKTIIHMTAGPLHRCRSPPSSPLSFTHMIYLRLDTQPTRAHMKDFSEHPIHVAAVKANSPNLDDILAMDWVHSADSPAISPGSALRVTFLRLKDGAGKEERDEVVRLIRGMKERFPAIQMLTCGETFLPDRAKGFSITCVLVFKDVGELERFHSQWEAPGNREKDLVKAKVAEEMVVEYVMPK